MNPSPHHGSSPDAETLRPLDDAATLIDDPAHPRQQQMWAIVEEERARQPAVADTAGDDTRLGFLVPDLRERNLQVPETLPDDALVPLPDDALVPVTDDAPDLFMGRDPVVALPSDALRTVRDYDELALPDDLPVPVARPRAESAGPGPVPAWVEVEERLPSSVPMVRAVSDDSLERAPVIKSTTPPPGPERSVVVQQVSPFGSDARVVAKPKAKPAVPPQHETVPFGVTRPAEADWGRDHTAAELPGGAPDPQAAVVAIGGREVMPQRFIATRVQPTPRLAPRSAVASAKTALVPLTSALCAVVVAVAALVNVLI